MKVLFAVSGLDCSACVISIDGALEDVEGVSESRTNYIKEKISVTFDPKKTSVKKIIAVIKQTGYTAALVS